MLRWLVLDLNSFFASCEQQEDPALRGKPVIVVPAMVETTCAIAASYPGKAFGIKTGTLVHEARRLCPDVQLVQAHHKLYVEYHHRILTAIDKHIPVEEVMSIDEVACRLDRVQQDPAVAQKLAHAIKREIQTQVGECLTSSIGISANKLLAKMLSRRLAHGCQPVRRGDPARCPDRGRLTAVLLGRGPSLHGLRRG